MKVRPSNESLAEIYQRLVSMGMIPVTSAGVSSEQVQPPKKLDARQHYQALVPLHRAIYGGPAASSTEGGFKATGTMYHSLSHMSKQSGIEVFPDDFYTVFPTFLEILMSPNLDDDVILLIRDFIKTPGIKRIIQRLANEDRDKTSGIAGELYHASELQKRGYRVVSFGFTASCNDTNILETDLIVERNGSYYLVEVKNYPYRTTEAQNVVEKNFLEIEEGKSKKLERFEKFIKTLQGDDIALRNELIQSLKSQVPEADLEKLLNQITSNDCKVLFSYPKTLGLMLKRTDRGLTLQDGSNVNLLEAGNNARSHIVQEIESGVKAIDELLGSYSTNDIEIASEVVDFKPLNNTRDFQISAKRNDLILGQMVLNSNPAKPFINLYTLATIEIICNLADQQYSLDVLEHVKPPSCEILQLFTLGCLLSSSEEEFLEAIKQLYELQKEKIKTEIGIPDFQLPEIKDEDIRLWYRMIKLMAEEMANCRVLEEQGIRVYE